MKWLGQETRMLLAETTARSFSHCSKFRGMVAKFWNGQKTVVMNHLTEIQQKGETAPATLCKWTISWLLPHPSYTALLGTAWLVLESALTLSQPTSSALDLEFQRRCKHSLKPRWAQQCLMGHRQASYSADWGRCWDESTRAPAISLHSMREAPESEGPMREGPNHPSHPWDFPHFPWLHNKPGEEAQPPSSVLLPARDPAEGRSPWVQRRWAISLPSPLEEHVEAPFYGTSTVAALKSYPREVLFCYFEKNLTKIFRREK